MELIMKEMSCL